jgi:hypothetical protein
VVYGNGSDGAGAIAGLVDWRSDPPAGTLQFTTFTVAPGAILIVPGGTVIRATGNVTISGQVLAATNPILGLGIATSAPGCDTVGLQPEPGGTGWGSSNALTARLFVNPGANGGGAGGCGAGFGGRGGGTVAIVAAGAIAIDPGATINADGLTMLDNNLAYAGGGGGGGIIVLASGTSIANNGTLSARGGSGASLSQFGGSGQMFSGAGGGGGGGIVNLLAPSIAAGTVLVYGGSGGTGETQYVGFAGGGGGSFGSGGGSSDAVHTGGYPGVSGALFTTIVQDPATVFLANLHVN